MDLTSQQALVTQRGAGHAQHLHRVQGLGPRLGLLLLAHRLHLQDRRQHDGGRSLGIGKARATSSHSVQLTL